MEKPTDCRQCKEPEVVWPSERLNGICMSCALDNDAEDFDRCEGRYSW